MFNKMILIIEDEESISDLLCYSLEKEGFITRAAYSCNCLLAYHINQKIRKW
jgi:DNA-binding response OmpR family regulator